LSEHFAARTQFGGRIAHGLYTASLISALLGTRLPGPGAIYISQTLNFRAPVRIGDQVDVTVAVAELIPERQRARLTCTCKVGDEIVLEGEAGVKVPAAAQSKRPLPKLSAGIPSKANGPAGAGPLQNRLAAHAALLTALAGLLRLLPGLLLAATLLLARLL